MADVLASQPWPTVSPTVVASLQTLSHLSPVSSLGILHSGSRLIRSQRARYKLVFTHVYRGIINVKP